MATDRCVDCYSMKKTLLYLALAVLLSGTSALAGVWAPETVGKVRRAVVTVYVFDKTGKEVGQGSGFFYKSCGRLITNYHVLGKASAARVKIFDGRLFAVEAIDAEDKRDDVVEAIVDMPYGAAPCLVPDAALPAPGEPLLVAGSPLGAAGVTSTGKVLAVGEIPGLGKCIVHDARATHGSSGGPVVNVKGEVIGIERAGISGRPNVDFAIPVQRLSGLTSCYRELKAPPASNGSTGRSCPISERQPQDDSIRLPMIITSRRVTRMNHGGKDQHHDPVGEAARVARMYRRDRGKCGGGPLRL